MSARPVVALEIGTTKVVALVGEMRDDNHIMIIGMGLHPSSGVRKGEIVNLENAMACARGALAEAEDTSKVTIRQVHLVVSGGHIQSFVNRGMVPVREESEITREEIDQVKEVARTVTLPPDREILHTILKHFCIDDQEKVVQPEGMEGSRLSLDMLVVHGVRNRLRNTVKVVRSLPMDVGDLAFGGLVSAMAVLTPEQKASGVIVIDLGGGTTDYVAYTDTVVGAAGVLGVGGDHVTNDIALAFKIPVTQAEQLKKEHGNALIDASSTGQKITLPPEVGFPGTSVIIRSLHTVINLRMEEILRMIKKRLANDQVLHQIGVGVVLTGGGANMKGIAPLAEKIFGLPCMVGKPSHHVSGLVAAVESPDYAACVGMLVYAFRAGSAGKASGIGGWFRGLLSR